MATVYLFLDKYYREWIELDLFCNDPIVCAKHKVLELVKLRRRYIDIDWTECERYYKQIRRYNALQKRLEGGDMMKFKWEEDGQVILVTLDDFLSGKVERIMASQ